MCVRKRGGFNGRDRDRDREEPVETELLHGPKGKHDTREITKMKVEEMICRGPRRGWKVDDGICLFAPWLSMGEGARTLERNVKT